jgi:hypothetical protein
MPAKAFACHAMARGFTLQRRTTSVGEMPPHSSPPESLPSCCRCSGDAAMTLGTCAISSGNSAQSWKFLTCVLRVSSAVVQEKHLYRVLPEASKLTQLQT